MELRAEDTGFASSARKVFAFDAAVDASRERVFAAIVADPQTWKAWFPGITGGGYVSAGEHGVGATRILGLAGTRVQETILVHDPPRRWSYRVDAATLPIARAIVETWVLDELAGGTRVRWTFAIDPTPWFYLLPLPKAAIGAVWRRGMRNLGARLTLAP
jgi:uncharacterized protein YndB with AHSA1/START domain